MKTIAPGIAAPATRVFERFAPRRRCSRSWRRLATRPWGCGSTRSARNRSSGMLITSRRRGWIGAKYSYPGRPVHPAGLLHALPNDHRRRVENVTPCPGCGAQLFVRDHFSRRLAAFMGVKVDAEAPGEFPRRRFLRHEGTDQANRCPLAQHPTFYLRARGAFPMAGAGAHVIVSIGSGPGMEECLFPHLRA